MVLLRDKLFVCSWSGGKDGCLAFYRAIRAGARPLGLLNMAHADGMLSRSHGLPVSVLTKQSELIKTSLVITPTSNEAYRDNFICSLIEFVSKGAQALVCGDIDLQGHYDWVNDVCSEVDLEHCQPLWKEDRLSLLYEFIKYGFEATIVSTRNDVLDKAYLGRVLDEGLVEEFKKLGIDACGEEGEFHTVVTDGPIFHEVLKLEYDGFCTDEHYTYLNWK